MEKIYPLKSLDWVMEKPMKMKDYFDEYYILLKDFKPSHRKNTPLPVFTSQALGLPMDTTTELAEVCSINNLDDPLKNPDDSDGDVQTEETTLQTIRSYALDLERRKTNADYSNYLKCKERYMLREIPLHDEFRSKKSGKVLSPDTFLCTVRIYTPYDKSDPRFRCDKILLSQEYLVPSELTLMALRNKITCLSDICIPQQFQAMVTEAKMPESALFFLGDTFYIDPRGHDYSEIIREWASKYPDEMGPFHTALLTETTFGDLSVRLGFPYLYLHQGNCEHIVVFSDARLKHSKDPNFLEEYPLLTATPRGKNTKCKACGLYQSKWITFNNDNVPEDPVYLCDKCYYSFSYVSGRQVEGPTSAPFHDKFSLLPNYQPDRM